MVEILTESRKSKELPIIIILDCCRSESQTGAIFNEGDSLQGTSVGIGREANIAILYSTAQGQVAMDGDEGHSRYTRILLESLAKGLTLSEINHEITTRLVNCSQQVRHLFFPLRFSLHNTN